ncbi:MAG: aspartate kinase, partial [Aggregatilineales bacterium]
MKFGGTSVGSPEALENVIQIVQKRTAAGDSVVMVVSAMSGVTNMLLRCTEAAIEGDKWTYQDIAGDIRFQHTEAINTLMPPSDSREKILDTLEDFITQLIELCDAIQILREATPRIRDSIVSFGERLSSRMIAAILASQGINARQFDSTAFLITDDNFQNAEPLWDITEKRIQDNLKPHIEQGIIPVLTGFIGAAPDGSITTLGRGGSDYSAAIFAANLESDELIIWTDVDGVMTTDPRLDNRAKVLPYVSYQEVGELAFYGAKVLHPKTVQPIVSKNIPMRVRNTFNPDFEGTLIGAESRENQNMVQAVTSIRDVSMLTVSGRGMLGVPGIAGRAFLATANAGANILMISQSSSEQSFCYTVVDAHAERVKDAVESELSEDRPFLQRWPAPGSAPRWP